MGTGDTNQSVVSYERRFEPEELFFSATDRKGIMRLGNSVFTRVSGYDPDELFGKPHNLVRHPDMPRAVFKLFWDRLADGRPVAAYVKNRAKNGSFYWVVASASPTRQGFLSIRSKPTDVSLFGAVEQIYRDVRAIETRLEGDGWARSEVVAASGSALMEQLAAAGFRDYDAFMQAMIVSEVRGRDGIVGERPLRRATLDADDARLFAMAAQCGALGHHLDEMFSGLGDYLVLNTALADKTQYLSNLAEHISVVSLNAVLAASKMAGANGPLGVIAHGMRTQGDRATGMVRRLAEETGATVLLLSDLSYKVALAKLQNEMAAFFIGELAGGSDVAVASGGLDELVEVLLAGGAAAAAAVDELAVRLRAIDSIVVALLGELRQLSFSELNGRVEASRLGEQSAFAALFADVQHQIETATNELRELQRAAGKTTTFRLDEITNVLTVLQSASLSR